MATRRLTVGRTLFVEVHHLGEDGAVVRREVMQHLADYMLETINTQDAVLTPTMAMAAVGGIQELVLLAIERGEAARLDELTASASAVVRLLAGAPAAPAATAQKKGPPKRAD